MERHDCETAKRGRIEGRKSSPPEVGERRAQRPARTIQTVDMQTDSKTESEPQVRCDDGLGCPATYRKFEYHTMVVGDDAECIALLTQVMQSYPNANRAAVAAWFSQAYGHPNAEVSEGGTRDSRIETAAQSRPSLH